MSIVSAQRGRESRLRLISTGESTVILSGDHRLVTADTMFVATPVRIVVPNGRFTFTASTSAEDSSAVLVTPARPRSATDRGLFTSTIYTPFALTRSAPDSLLRLNASRTKSERVP